MPIQRWILGISGASGAVYGIRLLQELQKRPEVETHLVITRPAERTILQETSFGLREVQQLASFVHSPDDIGAAIAGGSFRTQGMVVAPCSMRSASAIAHSLADNLLVRAADVVLKEGRKLILLARESPLHAGHLETMLSLARMGVTLMPPMPAFYTRPQSIQDLVDQTVGRTLDHMGIEHNLYSEWKGISLP